MLTVLLLLLQATAGEDYGEQARKVMALDNELEEVERRLMAPAAAPPAAKMAQTGLPVPPQAALPLEPNSEVDSVTVYRDRALVTRAMTEPLPAGASSLTFEGLPLNLDAGSLSAAARDAGVRIVGVELLSGQGDVLDTERIQTVRAEMRRIADELGQIRDRIESLLAQRAYLRGTLLTPPSGDRPVPGLDVVRGSLAFIGDTERDIAARLRKETERAQELDDLLTPLLIKLDNPLATGMTVRVDVHAAKAAEATVALRYQVWGASWTPSYDARLDEATGQVTLEYNAVVRQVTGETWDDADLLLSTANAAIAGDLPRLDPWYLGREDYGSFSQSLAAGRGLYADEAPAASAAPAEPIAAQTRGAGAVVFTIDGRRTVAGDGSEQRVFIARQQLAATLELQTIPRAVPEVYRRATMRFTGDAPLLPGAVATFVGPDYVGSGSIDEVVPGEELSLAFGLDDRIKVDRQLVERRQEQLARGARRYTFRFRVHLSNFTGKAQTVILSDQLPVSEIEHVTVAMLDGTPPLPATPTDPAGVLRWKVELAPGAKKTVDFGFTVTAPKDVQTWALDAML
jgi:uncharacterized protein (TIGR02231 family)